MFRRLRVGLALATLFWTTLLASALDQAMASKLLNQLTPTGTAGIPGSTTLNINVGAMFLKLTSTASTASASGTEITNGTGYTTNGLAFSTASAASTSGAAVTMPLTTPFLWTVSGTNFAAIQSLEITDHVQLRIWFGNWTGAPIAVANGNSFQVAASAISASLS
ncbi:MAG: hypothetical protein M3Y33_19875 [Actinomycetota bacterium]|nr:hypothetical protein [Actinomycetota bacterium]